MTQPTSHGYPDFGRYQARADKLIDQVTGNVISADTTHGRYFVGDLPFIILFAGPSVAHMLLRVRYWDASSGGNLLSGFTFSFRQNSSIDMALPVGGPWLELFVVPSTANTEYSFILSSSHSYAINHFGQGVENILLNVSQNIATATTLDVTATRVWPTEAQWAFFTNSTNWELRIEAIDYLGTLTRLDNLTGTATTNTRSYLYLPPTTMRVRLINNDALTRFFFFSLNARPLGPGY